MVYILTDSTADLSIELIHKHNLNVIPLNVILENKTFRDGIDITTQELFDMVAKVGVLPKTSAPSVAEFVEFFNHLNQTIYIGISSKLSACFQNAILASQEYEPGRVTLIDTLNLSTGIGMLAVLANELQQGGSSVEEIKDEITRCIPKVRSSFVIDKFDYLYMGGRCTAMQSIVGSLLKIHPVIEVKSDGTLGIKDKVRGSRRKALDAMISGFSKDLTQVDMHRVFITHTGCYDDAAYLETQIRAICSPDEICITVAGSVIASHCGPNTIGILYMLK
jgi:DegV family protein with EDD domain